MIPTIPASDPPTHPPGQTWQEYTLNICHSGRACGVII